jgi:hypothetical protein
MEDIRIIYINILTQRIGINDEENHHHYIHEGLCEFTFP